MSPMPSGRRISAPSPKLSASGTAPTIDSDWTTHLDRFGSSACNVNPDPVLIQGNRVKKCVTNALSTESVVIL
jgi:hypothetical protein